MLGRAVARRQATVEVAADERLLALVRASGLKMTPQRMAIVREVAGDESHPSAQELFDRLRPGMPTMSFATVYNTLTALCAAGLGTSLSLAPGSARFDPNMHAHDHAVCDRCGAVRDIPESTPTRGASPARQALTKTSPGFELRVVEQIFRGVCVDCAGQPPSASGNKPGGDDDQKQSRRPSAKRKDRRS